eukprot:scaffold2261_cov405-Prasinococcus_capsulatus_cf.AAC.5
MPSQRALRRTWELAEWSPQTVCGRVCVTDRYARTSTTAEIGCGALEAQSAGLHGGAAAPVEERPRFVPGHRRSPLPTFPAPAVLSTGAIRLGMPACPASLRSACLCGLEPMAGTAT